MTVLPPLPIIFAKPRSDAGVVYVTRPSGRKMLRSMASCTTVFAMPGGAMSVRVCVLGSGSKGNCTLLATDKTRLLVDAGLSCKETYARLAAIGEPVDGCMGIM